MSMNVPRRSFLGLLGVIAGLGAAGGWGAPAAAAEPPPSSPPSAPPAAPGAAAPAVPAPPTSWRALAEDVRRETSLAWRRAAAYFQHMKRTSKVRYGYTIRTDVTTGAKGDFCPGYWWSEQLKYYWLMFGDVRRFNYRDHYLSTEGNLLRGARR